MNYFAEIGKDNELIIIVDSSNCIVYKSNVKPISKFMNLYNENQFDDEYTIYTYQAGTALAVLSRMMKIEKINTVKLSKPGKVLLDSYSVKYEFNEIIDFVKSSSNPNKICGIEKKLIELDDLDKQIEHLVSVGKKTIYQCSIR
ncbi:DUF1893 domain-containing protein [Maledivibacter halophilus]|uniref:Uncharacterized protein n=1 Tax=Maledivibacter halophilus TaxID=36842 RepID=A0A1T5IUK3_9FIRM|nr:DUF1893 domain-containing protein [Maledivibacter halophilus]SKC42825.1 protein of unknown function [Maledivibacter halophilus]